MLRQLKSFCPTITMLLQLSIVMAPRDRLTVRPDAPGVYVGHFRPANCGTFWDGDGCVDARVAPPPHVISVPHSMSCIREYFMKKIFLAMLALSAGFTAMPAFAGPCIFPTDTAADGSRCGDRASTIRPGGK